ncbi:tetratricopeptide repeat protein [[Eubacterium] cellulosolvens]
MTTGYINSNTKIYEMTITDEFFMVNQNAKGNVVAQNLQKLSEGGVVLVTKSENEVVGYITRREIVDVVAVGYNPIEMNASQLMNTDFMEVMEENTLGNLMPLISRRYPNAIVVINYDSKCVGFFSKNDYSEALAALGCYDQSRLPESPEDWRTQGIAMSAMGRTEEALRCFENSIVTYHNKERGWFELARRMEYEKRYKDAILCYDQALTINPGNSDAWTNRGNAYSLMRLPNQAVQSYNKALSLEQDNVGALVNKGLALSDLGDVKTAIECYNKVEELKGETAELWYRKGNAYDKVRLHKEAIKCYERAIQLDNSYEDAWFNKGAALHRLGKEKKAIKCMEMVLKINPNNQSAREAIEICRTG